MGQCGNLTAQVGIEMGLESAIAPKLLVFYSNPLPACP